MPFEGFGEIAEKLRRSTVHVSAGNRGHGSGIIVKPDGIIVTNAHVAAFEPIFVQLWDGARLRANLRSRDAERDIAVLGISKSGLPAATLGDSEQLRVGELVIAIGNPMGFIGALTTGIVHAIGRVSGLGPRQWIQADVRLAPGNSGGPLADTRGRVVGLNTMIAAGVGLAIPSNTVHRVVEGSSRRMPLGVIVRPVQVISKSKECIGLLVTEIRKSSPAEFASLMAGDILTGVEGKEIDSLEDFEKALEAGGQGIVRLQFLRGDHSNLRTVTVRLDLPPAVAA